MIRHKGVIVSESYMNGVDARTKRLGMSMGKTLTSMLIGSLIEQGVISSSALVEDYVPELAGTGYGGGATVQNALDMCVGVDFDGECMQSCRGPPSASPSASSYASACRSSSHATLALPSTTLAAGLLACCDWCYACIILNLCMIS